MSLLPKLFDKDFETCVESVTDPAYDKQGNVQMQVQFTHIRELGAVPFLATPYDSVEYGRWLHAEALKGSFGTIAAYQRPDVTVEDLQSELDAIWPDVVLGIATPEELDRARLLRTQIKEMTK